MLDAHTLTSVAGCNHTEDGVHYPSVVPQQIVALQKLTSRRVNARTGPAHRLSVAANVSTAMTRPVPRAS